MKIHIPHSFVGLNEYTYTNRLNRYAGNKIKQDQTKIAELYFRRCKKIEKYPIKIKFTWYLNSRNKDLDNYAFAKKFLIDGMVRAGIIKNDNINCINGFTDEVEYRKEEGVTVEIVLKNAILKDGD